MEISSFEIIGTELARLKNRVEAYRVDFEDARAKARELLECMPGAAFVCGLEGEIVERNREFINFFGRSADIFPFGTEAFAAAVRFGSWWGRIELAGRDSVMDADARLVSWSKPLGERGGFIGFAREIEKKIEPELTRDNKRLRCVISGDKRAGKSALIDRLIETRISNLFVIEEVHELTPAQLARADVFVAVVPLRSSLSIKTLELINSSLREGTYTMVVLSKIDLERDDYQDVNIAATAGEKIVSACEEISRELSLFERLRGCPVLPVSFARDMNFDAVRWHFEKAASSVVPLDPGDYPEITLPKHDYAERGAKRGENLLLPMIEVFHDQAFQSAFARAAAVFEKSACVVLGSRRSAAHGLVARLAHDVSFGKKFRGTEDRWVVLDDGKGGKNLPFSKWVYSATIVPPESILSQMRFLIAPEDRALAQEEHDWDALFAKYIPVVMMNFARGDMGLSDIETAPYSDALKRSGFIAACGDALVLDENFSFESAFIYENYEVRG